METKDFWMVLIICLIVSGIVVFGTVKLTGDVIKVSSAKKGTEVYTKQEVDNLFYTNEVLTSAVEYLEKKIDSKTDISTIFDKIQSCKQHVIANASSIKKEADRLNYGSSNTCVGACKVIGNTFDRKPRTCFLGSNSSGDVIACSIAIKDGSSCICCDP